MIRQVVEHGMRIELDLESQVLELDATEFREEPDLSPVPQRAGGPVSAAVLAHKCKQFDDLLYGSVETAVQDGWGKFPSRVGFLRRFGDAVLNAGEKGEGGLVVLAACALGGKPLMLPPELAAQVRQTVDGFLGDEARSKPLGFYADSEELAAIFRQDRMLMTPLEAASWRPLRDILSRDAELRAAYERILSMGAKITNPPGADAAHLFQENDAEMRTVLPQSRSHEADLVMRLYGDRPIPDGFNLAEELARQVEEGMLSLEPRADSGWYDYQTWALEPLAAPERAREAARLRLTPKYLKHLRGLFKGVLALARETHVKQLSAVAAGAMPGSAKPVITIFPELSAEPLATHYLRRAHGYRFVAEVLAKAFGAAWVATPLRSAAGRAGTAAGPALNEMEAVLHGAHTVICRELGIPPDASAFSDRDGEQDAQAFRQWAAGAADDPDLAKDSRMMVPVFYDLGRRKTKVWALLGWSVRQFIVSFAQAPRIVSVTAETGGGMPRGLFSKVTRSGGPAEIEFGGRHHLVAYPVVAEIYVNRILNRDEFRRLCDKRETRSKILAALEAA